MRIWREGYNMLLNRVIQAIKNRYIEFKDNIRWGSKGKGTHIIKPMRLIGKTRIFLGDNVTILNNARLETLREWKGTILNGILKIGDNTSIEQSCHIVSAKEIEIGHDSVFSAYVYVSDCAHGYDVGDSIMDSQLDIKPVKIGNHCFVGIGSCIMPGVSLGDNVVVGANSVVTKSFSDNCMIAGSPAKMIKKYDEATRIWVKC